MIYNPPLPHFCDMCFIAYIENLCFKNCERPLLIWTKFQLLMQIAFEGSLYINIMMINLKKNSKEMTQLLEWSCLSGPQWLLYCVAFPASLYGPVPSWPGADDYSKVSLAKQVSLNIKFPVGNWPIWCQDPKKRPFQRCDDHDENIIDRIQHINSQSECQVTFLVDENICQKFPSRRSVRTLLLASSSPMQLM